MDKSTFAYYRLTDYYQNHRRYVKSRDDVQLLAATSEQLANPSTDCSPYDKNNSSPIGSFAFSFRVLSFLAPCGAIANSLFNDTFFLYDEPADGDELLARIRDPSNEQDAPVPMTGKDIAWQTDKVHIINRKQISTLIQTQKFDPDGHTANSSFFQYDNKSILKPHNWRTNVWTLGTDEVKFHSLIVK